MTHTDYYLRADTEADALAAAEVEGYDLVVRGEDDQPRWNPSPGGGRSAFAVTRGPVTGYTEGDEGEQVPIHAEGFFGLLRVPGDIAEAITALIGTDPRIEVIEVEQAPARFAG